MTALTTRELAGTERTLRQLELAVTRRLDGLLHGDLQSVVPGPGSDSGDGRAYQPGDDVRRIDWSLSARSNATMVRTTIADRELETWLVVDGSASLDFGTADCEKRDLALAGAAAFGFLAARGGNRVGAALVDPTGTRIVPPRAGRPALLGLLRRIERRPRDVEGHTPLADGLRRVQQVARRRGLVVVVSDLLDDGDWPAALRHLAARHDVVVVEVRDPREDELPDTGLLTLVDPETGGRLEVQTADTRLRQRFADAARERRCRNERAVRASGASRIVLSTDRDWVADVVRYTVARRRRR